MYENLAPDVGIPKFDENVKFISPLQRPILHYSPRGKF
jgi:hypothetical protein